MGRYKDSTANSGVLRPAPLPGLKKPAASLEAVTAEANASYQRLAQLRDELPQAEARDRDTFAAKLLRDPGAVTDPGDAAVAKLTGAIAKESRRYAALQAAVEQAQDAILEAVEANRAKWLAEQAKAIEETRREYLQAVDAVAAARDKLDQLEATVQWLTAFPSPHTASFHVKSRPVEALRGVNGEGTRIAVIVTGLKLDAAPPQSPPAEQRPARLASAS
jgi:hypothetical protein